jgi:integrase/recombinase XerD
MLASFNYTDFVPQLVPQYMNGTKITYKIWLKRDYVRADGTCALFLALNVRGERKRLPLDISVPPKFWDMKKQRIKNTFQYAADYNLIIEKALADVNTIEVSYRLSNETITLKKLIEDLQRPSLRINYNAFASKVLEDQKLKGIIKKSTYRQQFGALNKIKEYQEPLLFCDITKEWLAHFRAYLKNTLKNKPATVESTIKNFKKYLHAANEAGIKTELDYTKISVKSMEGNITFLVAEEVKALHNFYSSAFINTSWKHILQRYLFSCFTGLRISDLEQLTEDNFIEDMVVFTSVKNKKFQRIKLNETAKNLIELPHVFNGSFTREHINRELKEIAKACGIKKRLYFHSSRHTFATNYLISGGQLQNLQKLMGHSKITTTMVYTHVVDSLMNEEVGFLDEIVN